MTFLPSTMPGPYCPRTAFSDRNARNGAPHFHLFAAHGFGFKARRRLHGDEAQQLHHVVLHHIAQRAGLLVKRSAAFDAQRFRRGDLHVVDVVAIPDRLEDAVGEAEDQDVLHRLFAQVVIDAEDLVLVEDGVDLVIQFARRIEIVAEGLLDHDADAPVFRLRHALRAEVLDNAAQRTPARWRDRTGGLAPMFFSLRDAVEFLPSSPRSAKHRRS